MADRILIGALACQCIIGLNPEERERPQEILFDITLVTDLRDAARHDDGTAMLSYSTVAKRTVAYAQAARHFTLEALATGVARLCVLDLGAPEATVRVSKPAAIAAARFAAVEITRVAADFEAG